MSGGYKVMAGGKVGPVYFAPGEQSAPEKVFVYNVQVHEPNIALDNLCESRPDDWHELFDENPDLLITNPDFIDYMRKKNVPLRNIANWMAPIIPENLALRALREGGFSDRDLEDGLRASYPAAAYRMQARDETGGLSGLFSTLYKRVVGR
ncbi:MAG: hypothetical protein ACE5FT_02150 [Candidatus Nanoarchaeia archaeon]